MTFTGGNPWPFYIPTNPFGTFAAFSGSWGIWFKSNFTWKKDKDFSNFFTSFLGSKKLRFVLTTSLASESMWKAHFRAKRMRLVTFHYKHLTLTYGNFQVNRNTIPEISQIFYQQFSTFHSTIVVIYPSHASFERNRMFLTAF